MAPHYCTLLSWAASIAVFACLWSLDEDIFLGEGLTILDWLIVPSCTCYIATLVWTTATGAAALLFTSKKPTRGYAKITDREQPCEESPTKTQAYQNRTCSSNEALVKPVEPIAHAEDLKTEERVDEPLETLALETPGNEAVVEGECQESFEERLESKPENAENAPKSGKKNPPPPPPKKKKDDGLSKKSDGPHLRPLYWKKLSSVRDTVWSGLAETSSLPVDVKHVLVALFCKDKPAKSAVKNKNVETVASVGSSSKPLQIISSARATNIYIMMKRYENFPGGVDGLCTSLLCGTNLSEDDIPILAQIAPAGEELKNFRNFEGDASLFQGAELVLWKMFRVPRFKCKATCITIMHNWEENRMKAVEMVGMLRNACREVLRCERLRHVFTVILRVGNTLNEGSLRGKAKGVKVESLERLIDTRSTVVDHQRGIGNLLQFVAFVVKSTIDPPTGHHRSYLKAELPVFSSVRPLLDGSVHKLVCEIANGFELIESELAAMFGTPYSKIAKSTVGEVDAMELGGGGAFLGEQRVFGGCLIGFLREENFARCELMESAKAMDEAMRAVADYFGEQPEANPRPTMNMLLEFVEQFDQAFGEIGTDSAED